MPDQARVHPLLFVGVLLAVMAGFMDGVTAAMAQQAGLAPKSYVGSAMAVLATLQQADVLPPDNTPEATRIIKSVIQFQSAFANSDDPAVQNFAARALAEKHGDRARDQLAEFRSSGWTAGLLEALAEAEQRVTPDERQALAPGFGRYNLSTADFHLLMNLIRDARKTLEQRGSTFAQVYASHRRTMPGAPREERNHTPDGRL